MSSYVQLEIFVCDHCQTSMISDYAVCPLCSNDYDTWRSNTWEEMRKAVQSKDAEAISKQLMREVDAGICCPRCNLVKRPDDMCCFDTAGKMLPETASKFTRTNEDIQFGKNLKQERDAAGKTQVEFASIKNIDLRAYRVIESGYRGLLGI